VIRSGRDGSSADPSQDEPLWRINAAADGRLMRQRKKAKANPAFERIREKAAVAWAHIVENLAASDEEASAGPAERQHLAPGSRTRLQARSIECDACAP
jgi:hypothetical protein